MSWIQASRILLVWSYHAHVLNRRLDLRLVQHHAESMGAQVALVTDDKKVRFYAHQLGISVFNSPGEAQEAQWSASRHNEFRVQSKKQPRELEEIHRSIHPKTAAGLEHPAIKICCLTISLLAIFVLVIFILPSAIVILSPQVKSQSMIFDVIADPTIHSINYFTGSLPTYVQEVNVEGYDTLTSTGSVTIPDRPATGNLRFTNRSNHTVTIPVGTIVTTFGPNPVRFITTSPDDTRLDADEYVVLAAQAVRPGPSGNLAAYVLESIEGGLDADLMVTNPAATRGGTEATVPSPSSKDLSDLRQRLLSNLSQKAWVELQSSIPIDDNLVSPTIKTVQMVTESSFPAIGEPGNQLELTLKLRVQSQVVSGTTLRNFINPIMDSYTPEGYLPLEDSLEITQVSELIIGEDGKAAWTIRATR